jgi:hypothetical protein
MVVGDLILIVAGAESGATRSLLTPTDFTSVVSNTVAQSNMRASYLFSKVATGSEGSAVTVNMSGGTGNFGIVIIVLRNASTVSAAAIVGGISTSPNPPSLTPSFGTAHAIWFACLAATSATLTSYPSTYTDNRSYLNTGNPNVAIASRFQIAASDDPAAYVRGSSNGWHAMTFAVKGL